MLCLSRGESGDGWGQDEGGEGGDGGGNGARQDKTACNNLEKYLNVLTSSNCRNKKVNV